jgi:hypothetical protein
MGAQERVASDGFCAKINSADPTPSFQTMWNTNCVSTTEWTISMNQGMEYRLYFLLEMLYYKRLTFFSIHSEQVMSCSQQIDSLAADVNAFSIE